MEVITATVDLDEVRSFRGALISLGYQGSNSLVYPRMVLDHFFGSDLAGS